MRSARLPAAVRRAGRPRSGPPGWTPKAPRAVDQAPAGRAHAFATGYWILLAPSALSLMPAAALARIGRRERRARLLRDPARHAA